MTCFSLTSSCIQCDRDRPMPQASDMCTCLRELKILTADPGSPVSPGLPWKPCGP